MKDKCYICIGGHGAFARSYKGKILREEIEE